MSTPKPTLKLDWCSHEAAKYACEHWHYSRSVPVGKTVKVGVWEGGKFIGAVVYSMGANNNIAKPYHLQPTQCSELVRVALTTHVAPVSRIVALSMKMLCKQSPGLRLIVSYADPTQGHTGGIYQAMNWVYEGTRKCAPSVLFRGKWVHMRSVTTLGLSTSGLPHSEVTFKHKYLMPLDEAMRQQIKPLRKPYPKRTPRAGSTGSDAPAVQAGEGGADPTSALEETQ